MKLVCRGSNGPAAVDVDRQRVHHLPRMVGQTNPMLLQTTLAILEHHLTGFVHGCVALLLRDELWSADL